jgi:hypothetical protein
MPSDPVSAGRKGGSKNTPAQQAARKKNGFQPCKPAAETPAPTAPACVLISQPKEGK